jgi:hypothetical protein
MTDKQILLEHPGVFLKKEFLEPVQCRMMKCTHIAKIVI